MDRGSPMMELARVGLWANGRRLIPADRPHFSHGVTTEGHGGRLNLRDPRLERRVESWTVQRCSAVGQSRWKRVATRRRSPPFQVIRNIWAATRTSPSANRDRHLQRPRPDGRDRGDRLLAPLAAGPEGLCRGQRSEKGCLDDRQGQRPQFFGKFFVWAADEVARPLASARTSL